MKKETFTTESKINPNDVLLARWIDDVEKGCVVPIHNKPMFISTLIDARNREIPITLIALGCLDWQPAPDGTDPKVDRIIKPVFGDNHRAKRVAEGLSQLQTGLKSFGIESQTLFTLSDVEAVITGKLQNMGQRLWNVDLGRDIEISIDSITQLAKERGVDITSFSHLRVLVEAAGTNDLRQLQIFLTRQKNPDFHLFLQGLYRFDLDLLPNMLTRSGPVVWLNLISSDYANDTTELVNLAEEINPELPIVTPFSNAGSWSTAPVAQAPIKDKRAFISELLKLNALVDGKTWLNDLSRIPDERLAGFLHELGISVFISNTEERVRALQIISEIATGKKMENIKAITVSQPTNIIHLLKDLTECSGRQARSLLQQNGVRLNGITISDPGFLLSEQTAGLLTIGQYLRFKIN